MIQFKGLFDESTVKLPNELIIPPNFTYEKMIYEIAQYYGLDPKKVEINWDVYDYFEHLVFKLHKQQCEKYLFDKTKNEINN